jgi:hypothetical protein
VASNSQLAFNFHNAFSVAVSKKKKKLFLLLACS